jgi:putative membrane protein
MSFAPEQVLTAAALALPAASLAQPAPARPEAAKESAKSALTSADRKFVMDAAHGNMAEVELGKLAVERGTNDAVKQFGQRMVDDHGKASES